MDGKQRFRSGSGWNCLKIKTELRLYRGKWGVEWLDRLNGWRVVTVTYSMFEHQYIAHPFLKTEAAVFVQGWNRQGEPIKRAFASKHIQIIPKLCSGPDS